MENKMLEIMLTFLPLSLSLAVGLAYAIWCYFGQVRQVRMAHEQIEYLAALMAEDSRWLASNPTAEALHDRYLRLVSYNWRKVNVESIGALRARLDRQRETLVKAERMDLKHSGYIKSASGVAGSWSR